VLIGWISVRTGFYGGFQLLAAVSAIGFLVMWFGKKHP
jgi:dipeptide/tripeptide permease